MQTSAPAFYELKYIQIENSEDEGLWLKSSAPLICNLCEAIVYPTGGPGYGVICESCGEKLIERGRLGRRLPDPPHGDGKSVDQIKPPPTPTTRSY